MEFKPFQTLSTSDGCPRVIISTETRTQFTVQGIQKVPTPLHAPGRPVYYKRIFSLITNNPETIYCDNKYEIFSTRLIDIRTYIIKRDKKTVSVNDSQDPASILIKLVNENKKLKKQLAETRTERNKYKAKLDKINKALGKISA